MTKRDLFEQQGYIQLDDFISEAEARQFEGHIASYLRVIAPNLPKTDVMYDDYSRPETLKRISHLEFDPFFDKLRTDSKLTELARDLLQDDVVPQSMEYFNKPPGGSATPAHQDGYYFCLTPNEALTFWIPLDNVDDENGAMHYVAGSNHAGILPHHSSGVIGFSQGLDATDFTPYGTEVICAIQRGDALVHHCRTIHLAKANLSQRQRRVIGQVYFAKRVKVDPEMKRRYDEALAAQRRAAGVI